MSLQLILMRHAKSAWDDPTLDDHARVLNKRGRRSAMALGDWMRQQGIAPDLVLCSDASRTQETLGLLGLDAPVTLSRGLYLASEDRMMDMVQAQSAASLMVVGHNPGIAALAALLAAKAPAHEGFYRYPTGATCVMRFAASDWGQVAFRTGDVRAFVVPRELLGE